MTSRTSSKNTAMSCDECPTRKPRKSRRCGGSTSALNIKSAVFSLPSLTATLRFYFVYTKTELINRDGFADFFPKQPHHCPMTCKHATWSSEYCPAGKATLEIQKGCWSAECCCVPTAEIMEPGAHEGCRYREAHIPYLHLGSHIKASWFLAPLFLYAILLLS